MASSSAAHEASTHHTTENNAPTEATPESQPQQQQEEAPPPSEDAVETCAQCSKTPLPSPKQCNKCHSITYCSKECQKAHFKVHKKECAKLAQKYVESHEPKMASRAPPRVSERNSGFRKWQFDT